MLGYDTEIYNKAPIYKETLSTYIVQNVLPCVHQVWLQSTHGNILKIDLNTRHLSTEMLGFPGIAAAVVHIL